MAVLQIRKAKREGARLVIGLAGISGSGKTYTALQLAFGLANYDASKIGFLDTENKRGSLYADVLKNDHGEVQEFYIGDLEPPFSPERYIAAIREFEKAGVEVLVIDSISHEYEGTGGVEEIAHRENPRNPNWNIAKAEHKKFMNVLLQSNMHIIACVRAREKVKHEKQNGKTVVVPLGIMPVCEKNFMFEMTASMMMWAEGRQQQVSKCPEALRHILGRESDYITPKDGAAMRAWVDGAKQLDPKVEEYRNRLRNNCEQGVAHIQACWDKTPAKIRASLGEEFLATLVESATAYDKARAAAKPGGQNLADLNEEVMGDSHESNH